MKIGDVRWECFEYEGKVEFYEWRCRTIRGGKAYWIRKTASTWGKLSKKHGDFGWLDKHIDHRYDRRHCYINKADNPYHFDEVRDDFRPTKLSALKRRITYVKKDMKDSKRRGWYEGEDGEESREENQRDLDTLEKYLKRNETKMRRMA